MSAAQHQVRVPYNNNAKRQLVSGFDPVEQLLSFAASVKGLG